MIRTIIGLAALVPAALNVSPAGVRGLAVPLCTGDGITRTVTVPVSDPGFPTDERPGCCAKGCHTGSRKKHQTGKLIRDNE